MIKVLYTLPALDGGGAEKIIFDYVVRMSPDFAFDFIVHTKDKGILEADLEERGCRIYHIPPLHENRKQYIRDVRTIIQKGNYDIIHVNQGYRGLVFLWIAYKQGIIIRIAHSHMAWIPEDAKTKAVRILSTFIVKWLATDLFACGNDAARWMWGKRTFQSGKIRIMTNAIDTKRFAFSASKRNDIRSELKLGDSFVIGNVARFSYQKNHEFLIDVFEKICEIRKDAVLLLIGRGELEQDVCNLVNKKGLAERVQFMGVRNDVPDLLNAMDAFVLPSRFEGLPVTLVEAQANGLPCYVSDVITKEIKVSEDIYYLSLTDKVEEWAESICQTNGMKKRYEAVISEDYNIETVFQRLEAYYMEEVVRKNHEYK